jgi:hypothetical protein
LWRGGVYHCIVENVVERPNPDRKNRHKRLPTVPVSFRTSNNRRDLL